MTASAGNDPSPLFSFKSRYRCLFSSLSMIWNMSFVEDTGLYFNNVLFSKMLLIYDSL